MNIKNPFAPLTPNFEEEDVLVMTEESNKQQNNILLGLKVTNEEKRKKKVRPEVKKMMEEERIRQEEQKKKQVTQEIEHERKRSFKEKENLPHQKIDKKLQPQEEVENPSQAQPYQQTKKGKSYPNKSKSQYQQGNEYYYPQDIYYQESYDNVQVDDYAYSYHDNYYQNNYGNTYDYQADQNKPKRKIYNRNEDKNKNYNQNYSNEYDNDKDYYSKSNAYSNEDYYNYNQGYNYNYSNKNNYSKKGQWNVGNFIGTNETQNVEGIKVIEKELGNENNATSSERPKRQDNKHYETKDIIVNKHNEIEGEQPKEHKQRKKFEKEETKKEDLLERPDNCITVEEYLTTLKEKKKPLISSKPNVIENIPKVTTNVITSNKDSLEYKQAVDSLHVKKSKTKQKSPQIADELAKQLVLKYEGEPVQKEYSGYGRNNDRNTQNSKTKFVKKLENLPEL